MDSGLTVLLEHNAFFVAESWRKFDDRKEMLWQISREKRLVTVVILSSLSKQRMFLRGPQLQAVG